MRLSNAVTPLFLIALLAVAACGRAGPLEPPPASIAAPATPDAQADAVDDRPFVLDGLLQ